MDITTEKLAIALKLIKDLEDLSETALAVLRGIDMKKRTNLPDEFLLKTCINAIKEFYPADLFTDEGFVYNSKVIEDFRSKAGMSIKIYKALKDRINDKIVKCINNKDLDFVLK